MKKSILLSLLLMIILPFGMKADDDLTVQVYRDALSITCDQLNEETPMKLDEGLYLILVYIEDENFVMHMYFPDEEVDLSELTDEDLQDLNDELDEFIASDEDTNELMGICRLAQYNLIILLEDDHDNEVRFTINCTDDFYNEI